MLAEKSLFLFDGYIERAGFSSLRALRAACERCFLILLPIFSDAEIATEDLKDDRGASPGAALTCVDSSGSSAGGAFYVFQSVLSKVISARVNQDNACSSEVFK